uniref:uncharacterized protein n=1 Tax=Pristiophorus japonicus TaxID=55135 RepID=UPI00398E6E66
MQQTVGILEKFSEGEDWEAYVERLDQYFVANELDGEGSVAKRRAVLLMVCGAPTYSLIKNLLAPVKRTDKSYEELCTLVREHLNPRESVLMARYRFYTCQRSGGQEVASYVADLAGQCEFDGYLEQMLRDLFVLGIGHETILRKLLTVETPTLSNDIVIAQAFMSTIDNTKQISQRTSASNVYKLTGTVFASRNVQGRNHESATASRPQVTQMTESPTKDECKAIHTLLALWRLPFSLFMPLPRVCLQELLDNGAPSMSLQTSCNLCKTC